MVSCRGLKSALGGALMMLFALPAAGQPAYRIDAHVDDGLETVSGTVTIELFGERPRLLLYPNVHRDESPHVNDVNRYWIYPRKFNAGWMEIDAVTWNGVDVPRAKWIYPTSAAVRRGTVMAIDVDAARARDHLLTVKFRTRLPAKYGLFGKARGQMTAAGGWHPIVGRATGDRVEGPPLASFNLRLDVPRAVDVVVNGGRVQQNYPGLPMRGRHVVETRVERARFVSLVLAPSFATRHVRVAGRTITYFHRNREPARASGNPDVEIPGIDEDYAALVLATAKSAVKFLSRQRLPLPAGDIALIEIPYQIELSREIPGAVAISDRALKLFPLADFRKFHEHQIVRGVYAHIFRTLIERSFGANERPEDVRMLPDAVGSFYADLYALARRQKIDTLGDVLGVVKFVPAVDSLIYAQKLPMREIFFGAVYEAFPMREELERFFNDEPRGLYLYAKLSDRVGLPAFAKIVQTYLRQTGRGGFREFVRVQAGDVVAREFEGWVKGPPRLNYRLTAHESTRIEGGHEHRVQVATEGAVGFREAVEVLAVSTAGERWVGTFNDGAARHEFRFRTRAPLATVTVDPRARTIEDDLGANVDQRFDNRWPKRWKWLLTGMNVAVDATTGRLEATTSIALRRVYDLRHGFGLTARYIQDKRYGGSFAYGYGFGPKVDDNHVESVVGGTLTVERLSSAFGDATTREGGTTARVTAVYGFDSTLTELYPTRGTSFGVATALGFTGPDSGGLRVNSFSSIGVRQIVGLAPGLTLGLRGSIGVSFADILNGGAGALLNSELRSVGGRSAMRGYVDGEVLRNHMILASTEVAYMLWHSTSWNFIHTNWVRGVQLAFFSDVAGAAKAFSSFGSSASWFSDIGAGLRIFFDYMGAQPGVMTIDVGLPLNRRASDVGRYPPVTIYFSFNASFFGGG